MKIYKRIHTMLTKHVWWLLIATIMTLASPVALSSSIIITDSLEDIGADGTAVTSRIMGGVTVSISTTGNGDMEARTYYDTSPRAFNGKGHVGNNSPLNPDNISLTRFISSDGTITDQPIVFDFSAPVLGFGLTTLDLLENAARDDRYVTLQAYNSDGDVINTHKRLGSQGASGLDLDWFVSSDTAEITKVKLLSNIDLNDGYGYGLDDLILAVPIPAAIWFFISGLGLLVPYATKKKVTQ